MLDSRKEICIKTQSFAEFCVTMWKEQCDTVSAAGAEPGGHEPLQVLTAARHEACLSNKVHNLLHVLLQKIFSPCQGYWGIPSLSRLIIPR